MVDVAGAAAWYEREAARHAWLASLPSAPAARAQNARLAVGYGWVALVTRLGNALPGADEPLGEVEGREAVLWAWVKQRG